MIYLSRDSRRGGRNSAWLFITLLFIVLVLLLLFFSNTFSGFTQTIGRPIWQIRNGLVNSGFFASFSSKSRLVKENEAREEKIIELQVALLKEEALQNENEDLKNILGRQKVGNKTILAAVLAWPPAAPYDSLVIDVGENRGIKVGEKALALGDLAVGEVAELHSNTATIRLYSTPGEKYQVRIISTASSSASSTVAAPIQAEAVGRGGGNFSLSLPVSTPVELGNTVLIPGIQPTILGQIEKIDAGPNDSFKTIYFKLPVDLNNLHYLEIQTE